MKKIAIFLLAIITTSVHLFAVSRKQFPQKIFPPKQYVERKYGTRAILFTEDIEDWLDQKSVNEKSPIVFYNSTSKDIEFEFHELKTKFNRVTEDSIKKIKGRETVSIKAGKYFIPSITFEDIEHIVFVFKEENTYNILAYSDMSLSNNYVTGSTFAFFDDGFGFGGGDIKTQSVYSIVFEITEL